MPKQDNTKVNQKDLVNMSDKELLTYYYNKYGVEPTLNELKNIKSENKKNVETDRKSLFTGPEAEAAATNKKIMGNINLSKGGSVTKNRIGGNDYRKGGYVLNTVDNRKNKR